jgi:hypothetical protein
MGTFAETAVVDYRLSFADQGKRTSVFRYCLQQTNGGCHFTIVQFSICRIPETLRHGDMELGYIDMRHGNMDKWRHGDVVTWTW